MSLHFSAVLWNIYLLSRCHPPSGTRIKLICQTWRHRYLWRCGTLALRILTASSLESHKLAPRGPLCWPVLHPNSLKAAEKDLVRVTLTVQQRRALGVNGPVVRDRPSSPSRLQTPALSEPALLNHIDAKTESSSPLSSCMQRDTPSSTSLASDSPAHHHSSAVGNSSSSVLNSSLSSQTKGIWAYITLYSCALRFNSHHHPCLPTDKWVIALLIYTAQELSSHLC